ncbi:uncharacterized protein LOC103722703 [Phoenix dactylifera]|uniref:Uncharacterized protein LOC103722703 n=1 Tax=Phoenix dactylifera TaxID=42345 RepID=A0A8B7D2B1_PHODC|nr:uncharacterized protein LOC103722703 [Phoenix dactylifera]
MANGVGGGRRPPATPSYSLSSILLLLSLSFLVLSPLILSPVRGDHHGDGDRGSGDGRVDKELGEKQEPDPAERAIGMTALTSRWDAIRTWAKLAWMNFRPPESWYRRRDSSAGEVVKEAATRSFEKSKETVAHTAESAAKVAGEAMHKTKEKVKRTVSRPEGDPDAEL